LTIANEIEEISRILRAHDIEQGGVSSFCGIKVMKIGKDCEKITVKNLLPPTTDAF